MAYAVAGQPINIRPGFHARVHGARVYGMTASGTVSAHWS